MVRTGRQRRTTIGSIKILVSKIWRRKQLVFLNVWSRCTLHRRVVNSLYSRPYVFSHRNDNPYLDPTLVHVDVDVEKSVWTEINLKFVFRNCSWIHLVITDRRWIVMEHVPPPRETDISQLWITCGRHTRSVTRSTTTTYFIKKLFNVRPSSVSENLSI